MVVKRALVLIADGSEEIEAVTSIDVLRRADIDVTVAGLSDSVKCSRDVVISPDCPIQHVKNLFYDAVILPGGLKGAEAMCRSDDVKQILNMHHKAGNIIGAICAAPLVLQAHNIAKGKRVTSYPSVQRKLDIDYAYSTKRVVRDGNIITSRGPGTSFEFALEIVDALKGAACVHQLKSDMLLV
ncbi:protein dj-1beta-like [Clytia hemisphaerica]|uniref:DJ-1/PfpI domain-containing protein n=1 Tax=Clytia hemisphaerica TaxID=252671 RepID=A0A7M5U7H0_9CNID